MGTSSARPLSGLSVGNSCQKNSDVPSLCVSTLLVGVDMPHDVVGEADDLEACPLGHLGEALCLRLVFEGVAGEVDA